MIKEYYNKLYSQRKNFFEADLKIIQNILKFVPQSGSFLDFGIGQGRMAIPFAELGFDVTGVDISEVGIKDSLKYAQEKNVIINTVCCDFKTFKFTQKYNLIFSHSSLQFLSDEAEILKIIEKMKKNTKIGGYNFLSMPTQTKIAINFSYMCKNQRILLEWYKEWEIVFVKEEERMYSNKKIGTTAMILAKKIK